MKKLRIFLTGTAAAVLLCACSAGEDGGNKGEIQTASIEEAEIFQEETGNDESGQTDDAGGDTIQGLTDVWEKASGRETISLERVLSDLEEAGIGYTGYYNVSGERLNLTLQDQTLLVFLEIRDPGQEYWERTGRYELMLCGDWFDAACFQERYLNEYDVTTDEYIWPDLSEEKLGNDRLYALNQTDLSIARNQVFARYGRKFADPLLHAVFSRKSWYTPQNEGSEFDSQMQELFTETEKENLVLVEKNETERFFRKSGAYDTMKALLSGSFLDLDGDGQEEQILYDVDWVDDEEEIGVATLTIRGADGSESKAGEEMINPHSVPYICSVEDGRYQVGVAQDGMSADFSMTFYGYKSGQLVHGGSIFTYPEGVQIVPGRLSAPEEIYHIQCEPVYFDYKPENGRLVKQEQDYYEYRGNEVTALQELDLYAAQKDAKAADRLHVQDKVIILGGDLEKWVKIKRVADGKEFWIPVEGGECILQDGSSVYTGSVFEGLTFYG